MVWDVLVIGGGPAGSTAARLAARAGLRVLLLEKDLQVGRKACGGGLTAKCLELLDLPPEALIADHCREVQVTVGRKHGGYAYADPLMSTVHRREFDAWLLQAAREAGADVRQGQVARQVAQVARVDGGWEVATTGETHRARFLIGADGVRSRVGRLLGLSVPASEQAFALALDLQADPDTAARLAGTSYLDFSLDHGGFGWVFPKGSVLSTGVGVPRAPWARLSQLLTRYLRREGLQHLAPVAPLRGAFIPRGTPLAAYHRDGCLLVGDAAGLGDPLTGEGIFTAIRTGQLAAQALTAAAGGDAGALDEYDAAIRAELLPELRAAREVADLVFGPWGRPWRSLLTTDRALRAMATLATGQRSYESVLTAITERTPFGWVRRWRRKSNGGAS